MNLDLAKVTKANPESASFDLVILRTGAPIPHVKSLCGSASTNSGIVDFPNPTEPAKAYDVQDTRESDVYAAVAYMGNIPVIIGWLFPEVCQMLFKDPARFVHRHTSDWYSTLDGEGNFEAAHPSGTYFRIGTAPEHEDLTGTDFDGKWEIKNNTDKAVHVHLSVQNAGSEVAAVNIDPDGNITITNSGDLGLAVTGNITSSAAAWAHTGDVNVTGTLTASVDVVGGGKHLKTHVHSGVTAGAANTGAPV